MEVNNEIFKGYQQENHEESINEIVAGYSPLLYHVFVCVYLHFSYCLSML